MRTLVYLLCFTATLFGGVATAQVDRLSTMTPDQRVHWLWLTSLKWNADSLPALRRLDSVRVLAQELGDERLYWYTNLQRILCRMKAEDASHKPMTAHHGAESYMERCPVPVVRASFYCHYGKILYQDKEIEKGLGYLFRGRRMLESIGYDAIPEAAIYLALFGNHYYYQGDCPKALMYLERIQKMPSSGLIQPYVNLNTIGLAYLRLKNYAKAEIAFRKAIPLAEADQHVAWIGISRGNLGNVLRLMGRHREALPLLYSDLKMNENIEPGSAAVACLCIAQSLVALDSTDKAITYIVRADRICPRPHDTNFRNMQFQTLTRYFKRTGDFHQASLYQDSTLLIIDTLRQATQSKLLTSAEEGVNAEQYLSNLRQSESEKEFAYTIRNIAIIGLFVLSSLLMISLLQYRTIRRTNIQLADQNAVIAATSQQLSQQATQLRTLLRELHHRVKNNLDIVASLLNLQSYRLTDKESLEAVQESQQRVEAMSLIHQRLYRTDELAMINMDEFITDLTESLIGAYGYNLDTFDLSIQVFDSQTDIDVAIPVGLILNELLTNAFKYAFTKTPAGTPPALQIAFGQTERTTVLEVQDNGPGLDLDAWREVDSDSDSFGRQLIFSLTEQLGGQLTVENRGGAFFRLLIPPSDQVNE